MNPNSQQRVVILDWASLGLANSELERLKQDNINLSVFDHTQAEQVNERIKDADFVMTNKVALNQQALSSAPRLKAIVVLATGINHIDIKAAARSQIKVHNAENYGTDSVVQHTFALILALASKVQQQRDAIGQGDWSRSDSFALLDHPVMQLSGKQLGIIGFGTLGQKVATVAEAFGMQVKIWDRTNTGGANRMSLDALLSTSDVLTLHCPLSEQTQHLISREQFKKMKPDVLLVNCARGGIVDEQALIEALDNNRIGGAATDVLTTEPPPQDHVLLTRSFSNLIVTPHMAWSSLESRLSLWKQSVDHVKGYL